MKKKIVMFFAKNKIVGKECVHLHIHLNKNGGADSKRETQLYEIALAEKLER